ncbi:protein ABHD15 [Hydra vulgaris]|uniref:Protein ABHD15 n=1 Tax=Hydra vulgaris TaxID=6087 RepID=A0ABM4BTI1_HYDVU
MLISIAVLTIAVVLFVLFVYNKCYTQHSKTKLYCKDNLIKNALLRITPAIKEDFVPTFWANSSFLQTWMRTLIRIIHTNELVTKRQYVEMRDDGITSLDFIYRDEVISDNETKPILVIIPSVLNTHRKSYTQLCNLAISNGYRPIVFNKRGYSKTPLSHLSSLSSESDFDDTFAYISKKYPFSDLYVIAYSMEATNFVNCLYEYDPCPRILGVVCISATFGCENFTKNLSIKEPYNRLLTEKLKSIYLQHSVVKESFNYNLIQSCKAVDELQKQISKPGYKLYRPIPKTNTFFTPVLFINSVDDPVVPVQCLPYSIVSKLDNCFLLTTEKGGHCGFYEGFVPLCWAEKIALNFFEKAANNKKLFSSTMHGSRSRSATCY